MIEDNAAHDPSEPGAHLLAEVMYAVEQLPHEPSAYSAIYDLAVTCEQSGFVESSLVLYDRCLRLSISDDDLQTTYANLTAAYHAAAATEPDPAKRNRHLHDGLYAATAALDPEGSQLASPDVCGAGPPRRAVRRDRSSRIGPRRCPPRPRHGPRARHAPRAGGGRRRRGARPLALVARHDRPVVDRRGQGDRRRSRRRRSPATVDRRRGRRAVEHGSIRRGTRRDATRRRAPARQAAPTNGRPVGERPRRRRPASRSRLSARPTR